MKSYQKDRGSIPSFLSSSHNHFTPGGKKTVVPKPGLDILKKKKIHYPTPRFELRTIHCSDSYNHSTGGYKMYNKNKTNINICKIRRCFGRNYTIKKIELSLSMPWRHGGGEGLELHSFVG